jgi:hypothetical protein
MSFQLCATLDQFLEIPLEDTRELNAVLLRRVSQLSAMEDHNCLMVEQRSKVLSFLQKQRVLLPPREDFGLFFTLVGHLH